MAWRDEMQQGSFRGVPFLTTNSDGNIGRRTVVNEYPDKDEAYIEDLGLKVRSFTLNIFVLGENYMRERDALEAAFEQKGAGELVHPWRGRMTVSVTDCKPTESIDQGGRQSWSVTFTQTGVNQQPSMRADTQAVVDMAADDAVLAVQEDFAESFTVDKMPEFVETDALSQLNDLMANVLDTARNMLPDISIMPAFIGNAASILAKATQLMRLPTNLAIEVSAQMAAIQGLASSPLAALNALKRLFGISHQSVNRTTTTRKQQDDNRAALANLTRRVAIIEAARSVSSVNFESRNQAVANRDVLVDAIENEQLNCADDVFNKLADLRAAVVSDINTRATNLPELISYTPKATLPAVVLAYQFYGDAKRDIEMITRNNIAHPGFVRGGQPLEVLSNG